MSQRVRAPVACCLLRLAATPVRAAEWKHELAPYLWGSAMEGTVGVGDVSAEAEMSFSDILDDLEFGFMGTYRATRDRHFARRGWQRRGAERESGIQGGRRAVQ